MRVGVAMKIALITGITGQDGAYLAELLLNKGYIVHGIKRRSSLLNTSRIDRFFKEVQNENSSFFLHYSDMTDSTSLIRIIQQVQPDEIYNLAAMSHVHVSFDTPEYTGNADGIGTLRLLEAVRLLGLTEKTKIYQASTSELFGKVQTIPQNEKTPFYPRSPYGVAKLYAYWITVNYREAYGMFASNGILFNHESPLRGETFVTRKITRGLARILYGFQPCLYLGNLNAKRDWGHARDYVDAMHRMLQHHKADDFVIATGRTEEIRTFIKMACRAVGIQICFRGEATEEVGIIDQIDSSLLQQALSTGNSMIQIGQTIVRVDPRYYRPTEVELLIGDPRKAENELGWVASTPLETLVNEMMSNDISLTKREWDLQNQGHEIIESCEL